MAPGDSQDRVLALHQHRRTQPHKLRLPMVGGVACEGVVEEGHGGLTVNHFAEGVEVAMLDGVLVLPGLLPGGLVGGEEQGGALHPHMTMLRLVHGLVRAAGTRPHNIADAAGE